MYGVVSRSVVAKCVVVCSSCVRTYSVPAVTRHQEHYFESAASTERGQMMNFPGQKLSSGPRIQGHTLYHCAEAHVIILDDGLLHVSHTEYDLVMLLFQHAENSTPFAPFTAFMQCFKQPQSNLRRSLSRRINSLREQLWPYGIDIVNVRDQGYALLSLPSYVKPASLSGERNEVSSALSEGKREVPPTSITSHATTV